MRDDPTPPGSEPSSKNDSSEGDRSFESFEQAFRAGREEGEARAREGAPQWKAGFSRSLHDLAYGLAYGSNFVGAVVQEVMTASVWEGMAEGRRAGGKAGQNAGEKASRTFSGDPENRCGDDEGLDPKFS